MKKVGTYLFIFILSVVIFLFGFNYNKNVQPKTYYNVYLDDEYIGMIESKNELEEYINSQGTIIRDNVKKYTLIIDSINTFTKIKNQIPSNLSSNKELASYYIENKSTLKISDDDIEILNYYLENKVYNYSIEEINEMKEYNEVNDIYLHVDNVYQPNGIEVKKTYTYNSSVSSVPEIYKQMIAKKSCTIAGYKFVIKNKDEDKDDIVIYTLDNKIFNDAIERLITIFVDSNKYENYKKGTQDSISSVGSIIEKVYIEEDITYKAVNVSVEEKIFTDSASLSAYLLYGDDFSEKKVTVKKGDTIESIAFDNKISIQEFLIFNKQYTSIDNLIAPGTEVVISKIDPKIQIVVETYEVVDKETDYTTQEKYDETLPQGNVLVTREGQKGTERVTQNVKTINGNISYVSPVSNEVIKSPVSKLVSIGTKYIPTVGSTTSWGWPTNSGYTLSSYFGYRAYIFGSDFHTGLDIAGTGYGSPVYAANNGTVVLIKDTGSYGYGRHIMIDHNNGYYTLYAHMSGFAKGLTVGSTVSRGQTIGYIGTTGYTTGPHLHFEIRNCESSSCVTNPLNYYR